MLFALYSGPYLPQQNLLECSFQSYNSKTQNFYAICYQDFVFFLFISGRFCSTCFPFCWTGGKTPSVVQCRPEICVPKNAFETSTRKLRTRVCVCNTRIKNAPASKIISMYELAHCLSIVHVLLLVSAQHNNCVNSEEFDKIATRVSK